ncbi:hypothetical protein N431DRAFT_465253 [Stipitochalara longipes BDJ]|nr:hypothetical protein N431DRAFT_465253 [Stipitochalara longipes BDJ]
MTDVSNCAYSTWSDFTGSFQVNNVSNSIYSNLFLNPPENTNWGIATLTPTRGQSWFLEGGLHQMCDHASSLMQTSAYNSSIASGIQIHVNTTGYAPVNVITEWGAEVVLNVTGAFYFESWSKPLSLNTQNPGSFYACTDNNGNIGVYYRLNNTTTPLGCEDILFNFEG